MSSEMLWAGITPAVFAVLGIIISVYSVIRNLSIAQFLFAIPVILGMAFSLWVLYNIFILGAWPTYMPHIMIACLLPVVIGQVLVAHRRVPNQSLQLTSDARES